MRDVHGDLVLRPDTRIGLLVLTFVAVCGAGIVAAILVGDAPTAFAWIVGAVFAVLVAVAAAYQLRSGIVLTPQEIVMHGLVSRRRRPRSDAVEAVRASITAPKGGAGDTLFVLDAHRNVVIRVSAAAYTGEGLDRLVSALGVPCDGPGRVVTAKELAKDYPGLVPWVEQHPYLLGFTITAVLCAAALALALLSVASGS